MSDMKTRVEDPDSATRLYLYSAVRRSIINHTVEVEKKTLCNLHMRICRKMFS